MQGSRSSAWAKLSKSDVAPIAGMQRPITLLLLSAIVCVVLFISAVNLRSHLSTEWDEGVYLTTFQSFQHGFPLYEQTYFSQPPGFFLTIFPVYAAFGSTLESARLAVFLYSLVGVIGIIWLGSELGSIGFSFIAVSVLYIIPIYTTEILTFHADSIPSSFAVLSLAAMFRFRNTSRWRWLLLSSALVAVAVLVKADVSILPSLGLILLLTTITQRKRFIDLVKAVSMFAVTASLVCLIGVVPFGLANVYTNVITLRLQAANGTAADPSVFIGYLQQQSEYIGLLLVATFLSLIALWKNRQQRLPLLMLWVWVLTTAVLLLVYHPLMAHHMVLLAVPIAMLFAFSLFSVISVTPLSKYAVVPIALFTIVMLVGRVQSTTTASHQVLNDMEVVGVQLVNKYSQMTDYIVSDDGLITGLSKRRTPPALTDTSFVRIRSGHLTADDFARNLAAYRPKLVLTWTGRLTQLANFEQIMAQQGYTLVENISDYFKVYELQS